MGRWGMSELPAPGRDVVGVMSHLASADCDAEFTAIQIERFARALQGLTPLVTRHLANSAAALRFPAARFDAARCGIAIYGLSPFGTDPADDGLEPALRWESRLAQVKLLRPGDSTGYGRRFVAERRHLDRNRPGRVRGRIPARPQRHRGRRRRRAVPGGGDDLHGCVRGRAPAAAPRWDAGDADRTWCAGGGTRSCRGDDLLRARHGHRSLERACPQDGRRCLTSRARCSRERRRGSSAARFATSCSADPVNDLDIACREPERSARSYARRSGGAPFPLSERHGAWRVALDDGRTVDFTPLPRGHRGRPGDAGLRAERDRRPDRRRRAHRSVRRARRHRGARDPGRAGLGLRGRSAAPAAGRCGSRTSSASGSTRERSGCSARPPARVADPGRRANPRRARPPQLGRLSPPRPAGPARAARRVARGSARRARRSGLPARRCLRREPRAAADRERPAALRSCAPARGAAGGRLAPRRASVPPGDGAVGARRARLPGRGASSRRPCSPRARASRPRRSCAATSSACRPGRRSGRSWRRSRRSAQPERSPPGKRRSSSRGPLDHGTPRGYHPRHGDRLHGAGHELRALQVGRRAGAHRRRRRRGGRGRSRDEAGRRPRHSPLRRRPARGDRRGGLRRLARERDRRT